MENVIDHIPDNLMEGALNLLKEFQEQSEQKLKRAHNFKKIVSDNREVLERLAK